MQRLFDSGQGHLPLFEFLQRRDPPERSLHLAVLLPLRQPRFDLLQARDERRLVRQGDRFLLQEARCEIEPVLIKKPLRLLKRRSNGGGRLERSLPLLHVVAPRDERRVAGISKKGGIQRLEGFVELGIPEEFLALRSGTGDYVGPLQCFV